ncbi:hypothetical protein FSP39_003242 [Pinctada imbricata]|uniref:Helicase superfamily 3 single-stranded DNA/RNA virus domain-containing protein n=1 Tax=Pinctada imbricata TaxID=66713 RepID=A0AA88YUS5_PINIB|nr:hypothetical protein FSP39_003242 [Pinctada imbricata]
MGRIYRKVGCKECGKEFSITNIKRHEESCKKRKEKAQAVSSSTDLSPEEAREVQKRLDTLAKNRKKTGGGVKKKKGKKKPRGKSSKGKNFFLTFQTPAKYDVQRFIDGSAKGRIWIQAFAAGNEWGAGFLSDGHCHAVVTTRKKYNYEEFKERWKKVTYEGVPAGPEIADIEGVRKLKDSVRYVTKEDKQAICRNYDKDYCSILVKAYIHARKTEKLLPQSYPYCALIPWQQKQFAELFHAFREEERLAEEQQRDPIILRHWQRLVLNLLLTKQNDREVIWVTDKLGGEGKSTLAKYICTTRNAMYSTNATTSDFAYAYREEPIVIFDFVRDEKSKVNYGLMEQLKNGMLFSPKYMSTVKKFDSVRICCFANFYPDFNQMSQDRWIHLTLRHGKLTRTMGSDD